ncbi:hypothetical protein [Acinetobacter johnsonii]|uniref:hypothetical protein n=1 Tax=Acinetobacter johnsonii TaxID=40214 RepID=UPI0011E614D6|nr:hypothetical protein [Acinetobacter johnsonii]QEK35633.1 hypothetical protein FYN22_07035 [Acinetobacter johnsonii]
MYLKEHIVRVDNIKMLQALDAAKIDHKVIAMFMSCEGMPLQAHDVTSILNHYDNIGRKKLPNRKVQAMIQAKKLGREDDSLPCPV